MILFKCWLTLYDKNLHLTLPFPQLWEGFGIGAHMAIINYFRDFFKGKNLTFETVETFFSLFSLETH